MDQYYTYIGTVENYYCGVGLDWIGWISL